MRLMPELHMRIRREAIHPHPRYLDAFIGIPNHLLHLGIIAQQLRMAQHAFLNGGDRRPVAQIGTDVAIDAGQPQLYVFIVWKRHRLLGAHRPRRTHDQ